MSRDPTAAPPSESVMSISREEMSELPIRRYEGSVHVVAGHPDLQHAMQDFFQESVVGFDTETRPAFRPGESYLPSLVQFATASAVYLLQAQQQDLFGAMRGDSFVRKNHQGGCVGGRRYAYFEEAIRIRRKICGGSRQSCEAPRPEADGRAESRRDIS